MECSGEGGEEEGGEAWGDRGRGGGISLPEVGSGERGERGSMQQSQLVLPSPTMEEEGKGRPKEGGAAVGTPPRPLTPGMPGPAVPRWQHSAEIREAIREKMLSRTYEHVPPPSFLSTGDFMCVCVCVWCFRMRVWRVVYVVCTVGKILQRRTHARDRLQVTSRRTLGRDWRSGCSR